MYGLAVKTNFFGLISALRSWCSTAERRECVICWNLKEEKKKRQSQGFVSQKNKKNRKKNGSKIGEFVSPYHHHQQHHVKIVLLPLDHDHDPLLLGSTGTNLLMSATCNHQQPISGFRCPQSVLQNHPELCFRIKMSKVLGWTSRFQSSTRSRFRWPKLVLQIIQLFEESRFRWPKVLGCATLRWLTSRLTQDRDGWVNQVGGLKSLEKRGGNQGQGWLNPSQAKPSRPACSYQTATDRDLNGQGCAGHQGGTAWDELWDGLTLCPLCHTIQLGWPVCPRLYSMTNLTPILKLQH